MAEQRIGIRGDGDRESTGSGGVSEASTMDRTAESSWARTGERISRETNPEKGEVVEGTKYRPVTGDRNKAVDPKG